MKTSTAFATASIALCTALGGSQLHGQYVTLQNTPDQSYLSAYANDNDGHSMGDNANVDSLPDLTPVSAAGGVATASLTPDLTTTAFDLTFATSQPSNGASSEAYGELFFNPSSTIQYSISGETSGPNGGEMEVLLFDVTTSTNLLNYTGFAGDSTPLLIDSSGGQLTGTLIPGDLYEFRALQTVDVTGASTGYDDIMFLPIPEPSTWALMLGGSVVLGVSLSRGRRRSPTELASAASPIESVSMT